MLNSLSRKLIYTNLALKITMIIHGNIIDLKFQKKKSINVQIVTNATVVTNTKKVRLIRGSKEVNILPKLI